MTKLSELQPGAVGVVAEVLGRDGLSQRIMEMGVLEGDAIEVVAVAPFGDPMEIRVGGTCLSLRRSEAARILVQAK
jgi:ferrous iron transport protein A